MTDQLGEWCWARRLWLERQPITRAQRLSTARAARSIGAIRIRRVGREWVWRLSNGTSELRRLIPAYLRRENALQWRGKNMPLFGYARVTQTVNAEGSTRNVIRVPEKSQSIDAWLETYGPIVAGLPAKVEN
jgi:hypothetical protein